MKQNEFNVCGLIGIIVEVFGMFMFGLPCSIIGLVLGIIGVCLKDKNKVSSIIAIVGGALELLIMIFYYLVMIAVLSGSGI